MGRNDAQSKRDSRVGSLCMIVVMANPQAYLGLLTFLAGYEGDILDL